MLYLAEIEAAKCGGDADPKLSDGLVTVLECRT